MIATIDFETYSPAGFVWCNKINKWLPPAGARLKGLPTVGTVAYTEHPDAEVLCMSYIFSYEGVPHEGIWVPNYCSLHPKFLEYVTQGGLIEAWNSAFEYWVWTNICVPKYGFPTIGLKQLHCAMAKARAFGLPGKLAEAGKVLNAITQKDKRGEALLHKFSIPRNPTKNNPELRNIIKPNIFNIVPWGGTVFAWINNCSEDKDVSGLYGYCQTDVRAELEISELLPELSGSELGFWQLDQAINRRGVAMDVAAIEGSIKIVEATYAKYNAEINTLTDGAVPSASALPKLKKWLASLGINLPSVTNEIIENICASQCLSYPVFRVLQLRHRLNSAAIKKLYAMRHQMSKAGRLHNLFVFHGARTGRATGMGPQPQNLPNSGPTLDWNPNLAESVINDLQKGDLALIEKKYNNRPLAYISGCLRGMFIAAPGRDLICSDYSAIEAVVLAELAGEKWRQEVFRTHGMIYEMSASKITGIPFEEFVRYKEEHDAHHPMRKKVGKIAELASGYGGWVGSWKGFGAGEYYSDDEIEGHVRAWRAASPAIVHFWASIENVVMQVLSTGTIGYELPYDNLKIGLRAGVGAIKKTLYIILPSGRRLYYHNPEFLADHKRNKTVISFEGWNTNPKEGPLGWVRLRTYGGKLVQNITQAVAFDILSPAMINLEKSGYPIVLHVHDEIVAEVPEGFGSIEEFEKIMCTLPAWAANWPIRATEGWRGKRYRK